MLDHLSSGRAGWNIDLAGALGADKVSVSTDVLDRIDEIVPPGTTLNQADAGYRPPSLADPLLRRRSR